MNARQWFRARVLTPSEAYATLGLTLPRSLRRQVGVTPPSDRVLAEMATAGVVPARPPRDLVVLDRVFPLEQCDPADLTEAERARLAVCDV